MTAYILDTNVFNRLADGKASFDAFRGLRLAATHVQLDELSATKKPERAEELLRAFEKIDPKMDKTASAFPDVSNWDMSSVSGGAAPQNILARLNQHNAAATKTHRDPTNPLR